MSRLLAPEALSDPDRQAKHLADLRIPFDVNGLYTNDEIVKYEADSMMNGDFPYYCSGIRSHALCGEDRSRVIQEGFLLSSGIDLIPFSVRGDPFDILPRSGPQAFPAASCDTGDRGIPEGYRNDSRQQVRAVYHLW